jgi:hypothetical protein
MASLALTAGCGRIGFDPNDAAMGDDADAALDAALPTGPFGMATPVSDLNDGATDAGPTLTGDLLEIFFMSKRAGGLGQADLWTSTRTDLAAPWSAPTNVTELNTASDDNSPDITADGLTLYFSSERPDSLGMNDIYVATRANRASTWSLPVQVSEVSSVDHEVGPSISADGVQLYVVRSQDIYLASRPMPSGPWLDFTQVTEINTVSADGDPWISASRLFLVFASDRPGGAGSMDLWFTRRLTNTTEWDPPTHLVELSTAAVDTDPWLSPDERVIYFDRGGDIYTASR